jgi:hypothetical protein
MNSKPLPFKKRENPLAGDAPRQSRVAMAVREKYTATMDRELRKRVKIASVEKGIDFSQFIEEALIEKMEREGF